MPFCHEWGNTIQTTTGKPSAFVIRLLTVNCSITIAVPYTPPHPGHVLDPRLKLFILLNFGKVLLLTDVNVSQQNT